MYRGLAARYGWGPDIVAALTYDQILMYLQEDGVDRRTGRPYLTFNTMREAEAYLASLKG